MMVLLGLTLFAMLAASPMAAAQSSETQTTPSVSVGYATAPVVIDGRTLFRVRGLSGFPAERRAANIAARIRAFAADGAQPVASIRMEQAADGTAIIGGTSFLLLVTDEDGLVEGVNRRLLAHTFTEIIKTAVATYRKERTRRQLGHDLLVALLATAITLAAAAVLVFLLRGTMRVFERRYHRHVESIEAGSFNLIRAQTIWQAARIVIKVLGAALLIAGAFVYLRFVLGLFPWTRGVSEQLLATLLGKVGDVVVALLLAIPNLAVVVIVVLAARYALTLARRFFEAVRWGQIRVKEFDPEWATPTLRIVQVLIVALAAVIAYPYVPGSKSAAFQGISIFVGVLLSLGSSSLIANLIAGYTMAYRRAFRVGDRIAIGSLIGDVTEVRLMETHLRSVKNEELTIPNSMILTGEVTNFSVLARERGLILHTTVGIGYETPWRQVEAMLLQAAASVPGLMKVPSPFVLQKALGDFSVTYELNVYCDRPQEMYALYTQLHRAILDVFNEYGVQIMTPAYIADPSPPKIVPKEAWFAAPAAPPGEAKPAPAASSPATPTG